MTQSGNLWAIGYDDMERAYQVRDEIVRLGWEQHYLMGKGVKKGFTGLCSSISRCSAKQKANSASWISAS